MQRTGLLSTLVVSLGLLFQGCNQGTSTASHRSRNSGSGDAVVAAKQSTGSSVTEDKAPKGKGDDYDTPKGKGDDVDTGKGDDDDDMNDGGDTGDDNGKGDDTGKDNDDDNKDKGGKDQDPGQNPGQNPGKGDDDDQDEVDLPPVDIPKQACVYFDPDKPEFTLKKNQFGPNLPPVDVPSYMIKGDIQIDFSTYIGEFTVYRENATSANWMLKWDGKSGRIPHDYTMVVVNSSDDSCTAYVRFVKQEPRTNNGCFAQHTKIRMADGTDRVIALINVGDKVWNPVTKRAEKVIEVRKGKEAKPMYEIAFGGTKLLVTEAHPMPVKGGLKMAKDMTTADYLFDGNGIIHRVTEVKKMAANPEQIVLNIVLGSASADPMQHMVLADGMITGDLFLQRKLEKPTTTAAK